MLFKTRYLVIKRMQVIRFWYGFLNDNIFFKKPYLKINHWLVNCHQLLAWVCWMIKLSFHDDVIKWKHFPCYWPFVRGIHRSPVNSPHECQWRRTLMFSLICAWIDRPVLLRTLAFSCVVNRTSCWTHSRVECTIRYLIAQVMSR